MRKTDKSNLPIRGASGGDNSSGAGTVAFVSADAWGQETAMCRTGKEAQTAQESEFSK